MLVTEQPHGVPRKQTAAAFRLPAALKLFGAASGVHGPFVPAAEALEEDSLPLVRRAKLHCVEAQPLVSTADALLVHLAARGASAARGAWS